MSVEAAVAALRAGDVVVLPTDTVYGLCADAFRSAPARKLARLKGRDEGMPIALLAADLDAILDCIPELRGRSAVAARSLLPGPFTLVLRNPAKRFAWLAGERPDTIGIRVPGTPGRCPGRGRTRGRRRGHEREPPRRAGSVPPGRDPRGAPLGVAAVVDAGTLPGTPSTVVDLTGDEPKILREGAVSAEETLTRIAAALR